MTFPGKAIINHDSEVFCFIYQVDFLSPTLREGSELRLVFSFLIFGLEPIIIAWVLTTLRESLLPCSHLSMYESYSLITRSSSSLLSEEYEIAVSSAYIVAFALFRANGRSLMYSRKRRDPRHDPCGTPISIFSMLEVVPLTLQYCFRLSR